MSPQACSAWRSFIIPFFTTIPESPDTYVSWYIVCHSLVISTANTFTFHPVIVFLHVLKPPHRCLPATATYFHHTSGLFGSRPATWLDFFWCTFLRSGRVFWAQRWWCHRGTGSGVNSAMVVDGKKRESSWPFGGGESSSDFRRDSSSSFRRVWMWALRARPIKCVWDR